MCGDFFFPQTICSIFHTCSLSYCCYSLFAYLYALAILILHFISIGSLKTALQTGIETIEDQRQYGFTENKALFIIV